MSEKKRKRLYKTEKRRFEVHVYGLVPPYASVYYYDAEDLATRFAIACFQQSGVNKVKVWDTTKGKVVRNVETAPGLILHLV